MLRAGNKRRLPTGDQQSSRYRQGQTISKHINDSWSLGKAFRGRGALRGGGERRWERQTTKQPSTLGEREEILTEISFVTEERNGQEFGTEAQG